MKTFAEFKEAMKDEAMRKELAAFCESKKVESSEEKILAAVEFAAEKGFEITAEDLGVDAVSGKELSDEEVENAAGGVWCVADYSCYAIYSHDKCSRIMDE